MIDFVKVGEKIINCRKKQNLTQEDIAEKLFVSRQLVSKWENGTGVPSIDVLIELSKLFKISFEELLCLDNEIDIDESDIFIGHNRLFIVRSIIDGNIKVNLSEVFYQLSPIERMMVLKSIKEERLKTNMDELYPKLTPGEQKFIRKDDCL